MSRAILELQISEGGAIVLNDAEDLNRLGVGIDTVEYHVHNDGLGGIEAIKFDAVVDPNSAER